MTNSSFTLSGRIVDVLHRRIITGTLHIEKGRIQKIVEEPCTETRLIMPGFIDAHIHIESSMLVPSEFARPAVIHGTVATVSDPHEIGNVLGMQGIDFMLENARQSPFKFHFTAPSCVPATPFETAGAELTAGDIDQLLRRDEIVGLSEMMNVPGVLNDAPDVLEKLNLAAKRGKVVDGHSPGLRGEAVKKYIQAGINTDHECMDMDEALEKLGLGMQVQIREGSAARNLDDLMPLLETHYENCMLCSDDKHPDDLLEGHINLMVKRALTAGYDPFKVLWSACVTPVKTYGLDVGLLQPGDPADFIVVDDLQSLNVMQTFVNGVLLAQDGKSLLQSASVKKVNRFEADPLEAKDFRIRSDLSEVPVMDVIDGQLVTRKSLWVPRRDEQGFIQCDPQADILKIAVLNRYSRSKPAVALIRNFGIRNGAIASSVAHDSHNIVAVGSSDEDLARAMNLIIQHQGGVSAVSEKNELVLPLPVAGIMSADDAFEVGVKYGQMDEFAKAMGSKLGAPYMTLSFMALLVIPDIKLSDKGLFDGEKFEFIEAFEPGSNL